MLSKQISWILISKSENKTFQFIHFTKYSSSINNKLKYYKLFKS